LVDLSPSSRKLRCHRHRLPNRAAFSGWRAYAAGREVVSEHETRPQIGRRDTAFERPGSERRTPKLNLAVFPRAGHSGAIADIPSSRSRLRPRSNSRAGRLTTVVSSIRPDRCALRTDAWSTAYWPHRLQAAVALSIHGVGQIEGAAPRARDVDTFAGHRALSSTSVHPTARSMTRTSARHLEPLRTGTRSHSAASSVLAVSKRQHPHHRRARIRIRQLTLVRVLGEELSLQESSLRRQPCRSPSPRRWRSSVVSNRRIPSVARDA
jgi:hypothetical protein